MVTWGHSNSGGIVLIWCGLRTWRVAFQPFILIEKAFAALKSDGSVVTWGRSDYGGNRSMMPCRGALASGVLNIYSTERTAFAALKSDGSVVTWGDSSYGAATRPVCRVGEFGEWRS